MPAPTHLPDGTALANLWKRLGAHLIDNLLVFLAAMICAVVVMGGTVGLASVVSREVPNVVLVFAYLLYLAAMVALSVWYYVIRVRQTGATFGKQWLGLQIRTWHRPGQLTWGQLLIRHVLMNFLGGLTSGVLTLIDLLWCLWDPHRQTLHDKMAGTVVVDHSRPRAMPGSPELAVAAASGIPAAWLTQGPEPVSPPGYPHGS